MICWFENSGNDTSRNRNFVFILSSTSSIKQGIPIMDKGFRHFIALSVSRGDSIIPQGYWKNDGDRYLAPNRETI
ncbi:hypothetical protein EB001_06870 [bacterium]|nr:hypothetical protein [bacterium]